MDEWVVPWKPLSSRNRAQDQFVSLSLSAGKTLPHCHMLVVHPNFYICIYFCYILSRDPQGRFWSSNLVNSSLLWELIGNFISTYPRMSGDPKHSHRMERGDVNQRPLALLYQWGRCFGSLKSFQSRLTVRANNTVFLWSNVYMNFMCIEEESTYLGIEKSNIFSWRDIEPSSWRLPIDSDLGSPSLSGLIP